MQITVLSNSPSAWPWVLDSSLLLAASSNADSSVTLQGYQENNLICHVKDQEIKKTHQGTGWGLSYHALH